MLVSTNEGPYRRQCFIKTPQVVQLSKVSSSQVQICSLRRPLGLPKIKNVNNLASAGKCFADFVGIVPHARVKKNCPSTTCYLIFPLKFLELINLNLRRLIYSVLLRFLSLDTFETPVYALGLSIGRLRPLNTYILDPHIVRCLNST